VVLKRQIKLHNRSEGEAKKERGKGKHKKKGKKKRKKRKKKEGKYPKNSKRTFPKCTPASAHFQVHIP
jgi:hypothetical protein